MSIELSAKVNTWINLGSFVFAFPFSLKKFNIKCEESLCLKTQKDFSTVSDLRQYNLGNCELDFIISLDNLAKAALNVYSAGDDILLGEDGGYWIYFDAFEGNHSSLGLAIILAFNYAEMTQTNIVDDGLFLRMTREVTAQQLLKTFQLDSLKSFNDFAISISEKLAS